MKYMIFGAGIVGKEALSILKKENIECYIDNDVEKQNKEMNGIMIYSLNSILSVINEYMVIIAVSDDYIHQIRKQLKECGVKRYKTLNQIKFENTKNKIASRIDYIRLYSNSIQWILKNSINEKGIINNSELKIAYPEVTGYYIPSLIRWGYRELALQYANWLMDMQKQDGSWYDTDDQAAYIFDSAQILKGLLSIWDIHQDKHRVKNAVRKGVDWLLSHMTFEGRLVTPDETCWGNDIDTCSELIHTYCLSPIIEAGKRLDNDEYIQKAYISLEYYKEHFKNKILNFSLLSHFYAYVVEAMLDLGEVDMARQAMENIVKYQKVSGAVPAYNNVDWVCSTGLFQLSLIWFRLGDEEHGNKAFEYACKLQNESGGWFGSYISEDNSEEVNTYFPNQEISWANKYFLDALYYKNLCNFQNIASIFCNEISVDDGRYKVIKKVIEEKNENSPLEILDLGCGKGRYLKCLLSDFPQNRYNAVDLSTNVMEYFSELKGIEKKQGSLTNVPYSKSTFDIVYTCEALEHAVDIERAICEMARVTKSGGTIIVVDKNKDKYGYFDIGDWEQWFDEHELKQIMQEYCSEVQVEKNINFDDNEANGLFYAWIGKVK